ncbi:MULTISPECIES: N-acetylmuramic acid 6-phosphate etherase [Bacteroidota]|jgi:N-acetylmuramic acid 6-phosphate etherase|uniref:N-acetylmuramic acid 6-phosphate etherase n=1 Tax=Flectobacillus rivi TaxID=2984209 RepID=A0ABT6Z477_9BACT|nr:MULTISPECIES: N-acetylmuramic acid 6-phosphate etherase [Bacteroidota]MDI9875926.1 N-acetylmuramic acid 6-phosphate etherase [Flectobacillus rivi]NBB27746.1 N-acetylmuramic acid 6-phosphate etherase [Cellulophaga sp. BC115SP]
MSQEINLETLTTEASSKYNNLDEMSITAILEGINNEDKTVPHAVEKAIPQIEALVSQIVPRMKQGGRLFYIGAGTSGRLGIVDASECPPTFGVPFDLVIGIIAGGDTAIRKAVEYAEDDEEQAWKDLEQYDINELDTVVGIAASGRTPYVIGGLRTARNNGVLTGSVSCNIGSEISKEAEFPIEVVVGPEFVTGSTRMKSGTAQKLILNMISTSVMIQLGRIRGNKMVDMQLSNHKLVARAENMIIRELGIDRTLAETLLQEHGSVRKAIDAYRSSLR